MHTSYLGYQKQIIKMYKSKNYFIVKLHILQYYIIELD